MVYSNTSCSCFISVFDAFIADDELLEITPLNIRLRKKLLTETQRLRAASAQRRLDETV